MSEKETIDKLQNLKAVLRKSIPDKVSQDRYINALESAIRFIKEYKISKLWGKDY